jgi:predicted nuclease of predicted toxin-antitoxin system
LFIDECLSPQLAARVNSGGKYAAVHPRDMTRLREPDHLVLQRCLKEDRTIVTANAVDFRKLVGKEALHPGLIILPSVSREASLALLEAAIEFLETCGEPAQIMVNHVLEVSEAGGCTLCALPAH